MKAADILIADHRPFGMEMLVRTWLLLFWTFLTEFPEVDPVYGHGQLSTQ
jgi:hypothetical protein